MFISKRFFLPGSILLMVALLLTFGPKAPSAHAASTHAVSCIGAAEGFLPGFPASRWGPGTIIDSWQTCKGNTEVFKFQTDGNLVLDCAGHGVLAASGTGNTPTSHVGYTSFQTDGNLVVYNENSFGQLVAAWASNTDNQGATHLALQYDGNVVIYNGAQALWSTQTNGAC